MKLNRWLILLLVGGGTLAADQVTKHAVIANIQPYDSVLTPLSPFLRLTYSENTGAAFGFLPQAGDLFLVLAFAIVVGLLIFYHRVPTHARIQQIAIGLVAGGALGNAFDRLEHGAVIDWVLITIPGVIANVSNLADHAIVVGALTLVALSWFTDEGRPKANRSADTMPNTMAEPSESTAARESVNNQTSDQPLT